MIGPEYLEFVEVGKEYQLEDGTRAVVKGKYPFNGLPWVLLDDNTHILAYRLREVKDEPKNLDDCAGRGSVARRILDRILSWILR
jgi:hypothetical protein